MANPGNSDQITREYFDSLLLEMRHIDGVKPDVKFELFGDDPKSLYMLDNELGARVYAAPSLVL